MTLLAIDPGNVESGYCIVDVDTLKPLEHGKVDNFEMLDIIEQKCNLRGDNDPMMLAIERVMLYGGNGRAGRDVSQTAEWYGAFWQAYRATNSHQFFGDSIPVYRYEEKTTICGKGNANDSDIQHALIDRFAQHDLKNGKGTKKNPDWFYGFSKDQWAAYAVAVTAIETKMKGGRDA